MLLPGTEIVKINQAKNLALTRFIDVRHLYPCYRCLALFLKYADLDRADGFDVVEVLLCQRDPIRPTTVKDRRLHVVNKTQLDGPKAPKRFLVADLAYLALHVLIDGHILQFFGRGPLESVHVIATLSSLTKDRGLLKRSFDSL